MTITLSRWIIHCQLIALQPPICPLNMSAPTTNNRATTIVPVATASGQIRVKTTKTSIFTSCCVGLLLCTNLAIVVLLGLLVGKVSKIYSILDQGSVSVYLDSGSNSIPVTVDNSNAILVTTSEY